MMMPHEPPAPRPGRNMTMIVLVILLVLSAGLNLLLFIGLIAVSFAAGDTAGKFTETLIYGEEAAADKILLLRLQGVIVRQGFASREDDAVSYVRTRLDEVRDAAKGYAGVLLVINSPGGGVSESDEIFRDIMRFRAETGKPVIAFFQNVAASGGYYIGAGCDRIIAQPTTVTGSIGVIMSLMQVQGLMDKVGVESNVIISQRTPFKDIGSPMRSMTEEERTRLRALVDQMLDGFINAVAEGRTQMTREEITALATGMIYTGTEAEQNKLVDELGYFDDAVRAVRSAAGTPRARIVELHGHFGLIDVLMYGRTPEHATVDVLGVNRILEAHSGVPMYLWMPGVK